MDVTTLKLPHGLKRKIVPLARKSGVTPHAWMVKTLEREADRAARREQFIADSLAAAARVDEGGPLYAAEAVHDYILGRAAGRKPTKPRPARRSSRRG